MELEESEKLPPDTTIDSEIYFIDEHDNKREEKKLSNDILKDFLNQEAKDIQKNKGGNIKGSKRKPYKSKNNPKGIDKNNLTTTPNENVLQDTINQTQRESAKPSERKSEGENKNENKTKDEKTGKEKLADILGEYKEVKIAQPTDTTGQPQQPIAPLPISNQNQMIINGHLLLIMCDSFFPFAVKLIVGIFMPQLKKVDNSKFRLTKDQKESLEPLADKVAVYIFEKVNPLALFVFSLTSCYVSNGLEHAKEK